VRTVAALAAAATPELAAVAPGVAPINPGVAAPARLELLLDPVELWRRPVQPPRVARDEDHDDKGDPDRPEHPAGAARQPDSCAEREHRNAPARFLDNASLKLVTPGYELFAALLGSDREISPRGLQLVVGLCCVDRLNSLVELVLGQPPCREVLAQLLGDLLALLVGDSDA
jgi:hypothetical protein